ncbi:RimK family alpha-L-glutamate ligase [Streptosporangium sp. NPDC050855]|uniref:RimK family alpha-L-glutamate ligase n=1 Tax=Streptosporangium sp. NPDC050855 TaxID=3366194 RepID=UPI003793B03D
MTRWGIIGPPGDPQVANVTAALRERGAEPVVLDLSGFPARSRLSLLDGTPSAPGVDVTAVRAWYLRSMPLPLPFAPWPGQGGRPGQDARDDARGDRGGVTPEEREREQRSAYAGGRERRSFTFGFVTALRHGGAVLVNPPETLGQHFLKLDQLRRLREAAVPVPRTLATNDPDAVAGFARATAGPVVYKPLAGGALCRRITPDDLRPERLRLLATAPVLFQEEVPGRNLRVYVVDGEVAASYEIVSEELDFRGAERAVLPEPPSEQERDACLRAARACGLTFTGVDVRRRDDGTFAVLECNPSPMFAAVERRTGSAGVTRALAALLCRAAVTGRAGCAGR